MRGTIIQKILSNLDSGEFRKLLLFVKSRQLNTNQRALFQFLRKSSYSEEEAIRLLKVSKSRKNSILQEIGLAITEFFGLESEGFGIVGGIEIAKRLAISLQKEAALIVLIPTINRAVKAERFDLVLRGWQILKILDISSGMDIMSAEVAATHLAINSELTVLLEQVREAKKIKLSASNKEPLERIHSASLELFQRQKLSQKGQLTFLRIQSQTDALLGDSIDWLRSQEAVVAQIRAYPWICEDWEYEIARETRTLAQIYWHLDKYEEFRLESVRFWALSFSSNRAKIEQVLHQFPFLFVVAIQSGDEKFGLNAVDKFTKIYEEGILDTSPRILTQNIYFCAVFYLSCGKIREAQKWISKLRRFSHNDFIPSHLTMGGIVEAILAIEAGDFDDAQRILKNLLISGRKNAMSKTEVAIGFLKAVIRILERGKSGIKLDSDNELKLRLSHLHGSEILKYFDLELWFESKLEGHPMREIYWHRATIYDTFSFTYYQ